MYRIKELLNFSLRYLTSTKVGLSIQYVRIIHIDILNLVMKNKHEKNQLIELFLFLGRR